MRLVALDGGYVLCAYGGYWKTPRALKMIRTVIAAIMNATIYRNENPMQRALRQGRAIENMFKKLGLW